MVDNYICNLFTSLQGSSHEDEFIQNIETALKIDSIDKIKELTKLQKYPFYKQVDTTLTVNESNLNSEYTVTEEGEAPVVSLDVYIDLEKNKEYILVAGDQSMSRD